MLTKASWENIARAHVHPLRMAILEEYSKHPERKLAPVELAELFPEYELNLISYHVRQLAKLELIELVEKEPVRGTVKHRYRWKKPDE